MNTTCTISVAISTMERPDALRRCLASIDAGTTLPLEIVIVDQSRDDRTAALVDAASEGRVPIRYQRQAPRGLGVSQNAAVRAARGDVVAITDDDCVVDSNWLAVIASAFQDTPDLGALGGRVMPLETGDATLFPVSSRTSLKRLEFRGQGRPWSFGSGNNFAVKRSLYLEVGGCDERLGPGSPGLGGVDMDLFYRLIRTGAHLRYEPDALVYHEQQTLAQRRERRPLYGHGMGAALAYRMREGDRGAPGLLVSWLALRMALMGKALLRLEPRAVREELTMLGSTVRGLRHGFANSAPSTTSKLP